MRGSRTKLWLLCAFTALAASSCHQLNDERLPSMPVYIDMSNQGIWNAYGVHGYGQFNMFLFTGKGSGNLPPGFTYTYGSATGYGGVLLISGQNAFTGEAGPLAYDLSCPVERLPNVRVYVDPNTFEAVCPDCHSHYDVVEAGGAPLSGPALASQYAMTHYECYATNGGGYLITR